ncbi:hypothetical protein BB559_007574 [Furculomyces boomerangus]|uniref:Cyanovirin-N domain-containing protein n=1 Tax=Furculomyces boomerangus TaxID=61424 RepID=A0A2T9XWU4_9FUNG|nr:hypothetical protein BB559_007574 [Furculomyces boomerangus]
MKFGIFVLLTQVLSISAVVLPVTETFEKRLPSNPGTSGNAPSQSRQYQTCIDRNGGKVWLNSNKICLCNQDGTIECINTSLPPVSPYQKCLNDHEGKGKFTINGVNCICDIKGKVVCYGRTLISHLY